ncbi:hypothetical protein JNW90_25770 [Micromonospora sp. STR1s_5]|nr:hypothetical protein [Micromonospora sp. STR1s_5]
MIDKAAAQPTRGRFHPMTGLLLPVATERLTLRPFTHDYLDGQRWGSEYVYATLAHEWKTEWMGWTHE